MVLNRLMDQMNMLRIGMLLGSGIELGIGIDAQPDIDTTANINRAIRTTNLRLLLNFKYSPVNLYYTAQNQGLCKAFPGISQDP